MPAILYDERLVTDNLGLVKSIAARFRMSDFEYEDLVQVGCIGLIKAASNFKEDMGFAFSTYAFPVITGEIKRYIRDNGNIKISRKYKEIYGKSKKAYEILMKKFGREPTVSELAEYLSLPKDEILLSERAHSCVISLYGDDDEDTAPIDKAGEDKTENNIEILALREELSSLSSEDRKIVTLRYFKDKTQSETARIIGRTQVYVSRRENKILKTLGEKLS